jgi:hypothetical protein
MSEPLILSFSPLRGEKGPLKASVRSSDGYCAALTFLISAMSAGNVDSQVATRP